MKRKIPWIWIIVGLAALALIGQNQNSRNPTVATSTAFDQAYEQQLLPYQDGLRVTILVLTEKGADYLRIAEDCREHYLEQYQGVFCFVYDERRYYKAESESKPCFKARALRQLNGEEISELGNPAAQGCL